MMMKMLLITTLLIAFTGCASAPKHWDIESQRNYTKSYDDVWSAVVGFFAENSVPIKNMEKASGLIVAESQYFPEEWVDCGKAGIMSQTDPEGIFNVFVTDKAGKITVKVTTNMWNTRWFGDSKRERNNCVSTGAFEAMILDYISTHTK